MGAIIVQCPSCQARFHLAQERIPEKGARVRCSRCEHRFYVTSTGDVSESKPRRAKSDGESGAQSGSAARGSSGAQKDTSLELSSSAGSQPRARQASREAATTAMDALREHAQPARARGLGPVPPQEDADLDDPQFLFDDSQSAELPYTPGSPPGDLATEDEEEPSSAAFGDVPSRPSAPRAPDTDVTPQEPPPPAPEPAAESGSWLSNDDEAIPDIRAQRDELALQPNPTALAEPAEAIELTTSQPAERTVEPEPPPPAPSATRAESTRAVPREAAPGRYTATGPAVLVARSTPERAGREAPVAGPLSASLERVAMLVGALTAVALIFAGGHALRAQLREPAGPERVSLADGEISSVEVLHLRDADGHRVLAVRGLLLSTRSELPRVQLKLLDPQGSAIGAPHRARPGFLRDAELTSAKLGDLLDPDRPLPVTGDARGFTVLVRDPPFEAERFALEIAG